jgi:tetratricopeptide (TPR) repeat protein
MNLGDHEASRKHLTDSREISNQVGMTINEAYAEIGLSRLSFYESDLEAASDHLRNAAALLEDTKDQVDDRNISLLLLESMILAEKGEIEVALLLSKRALDMANEGGFPTEESEALRVYGTICGQGGNYELAEETLRKGIQLAEQQKNPYREARAHYELGRLYSRLSRGADETQDQEVRFKQAKAELDLAIEQLTNLGAQYDLGKALDALDMLSIPGQD